MEAKILHLQISHTQHIGESTIIYCKLQVSKHTADEINSKVKMGAIEILLPQEKVV